MQVPLYTAAFLLILSFAIYIESVINCVKGYKKAENRIEKFKYASHVALMATAWIGIIYLSIQWYNMYKQLMER